MAGAGNSGSLAMSAVQVGRHSQLFNFQELARQAGGTLFLLFTYSSRRQLFINQTFFEQAPDDFARMIDG